MNCGSGEGIVLVLKEFAFAHNYFIGFFLGIGHTKAMLV